MAKESRLILVDTSAWVAHFNETDCPETTFLDKVLAREIDSIVLVPIILTEVLQGLRTEAGFLPALATLRQIPVIQPSIETHIDTARMFGRLRRRV
jgi:predicted nucleic acid-binding protein